jgi:hypothetical protein
MPNMAAMMASDWMLWRRSRTISAGGVSAGWILTRDRFSRVTIIAVAK